MHLKTVKMVNKQNSSKSDWYFQDGRKAIYQSKASEKSYISWQNNLSYAFWFEIKRIHIKRMHNDEAQIFSSHQATLITLFL